RGSQLALQQVRSGCLRLRFHTASVFATSKPGRRTRHTPLPDPFLIAKSLLTSWQYHSPLRFSDTEAAALLTLFELDLELTRFADLRFERAQAAKGFFPGFTGAVEVYCHSESLEAQRALGMLQAYAFYAGVGAKTAYGLGLTMPY
ncbi:MAG: CRISPR system precrRNA processing endoribonuclease RAMP protein Cas6, partial [Meiothermus silvanus]|nr:CRISPR system precrRNA processing endoribonuclease RAMP protein Cas6 [Allomeiothermus silvanus]